MSPEIPSIKASDSTIRKQRADFIEQVSPQVDQLFREEGYMVDALSDLTEAQIAVFLSVVTDRAATLEYGRTSEEGNRIRKNQYGPNVSYNPLLESAKAKLRRAGIDDLEGHLNMIESAAGRLHTAYRTDPFLNGKLP